MASRYLVGAPQLPDELHELSKKRRLTNSEERLLIATFVRLAAVVHQRRKAHQRETGEVIEPEPPTLPGEFPRKRRRPPRKKGPKP